MTTKQMSDAAVTVSLALIRDALMCSGEGGAKRVTLALMGKPTIQVEDMKGVLLTVIVSRVHGWGPHYEGGTIITFRDDPFGEFNLVVNEEVHRVTRALRENGWEPNAVTA